MDIKELNQTNLFKGTTSDEAEQMLNCLSAYQKEYRKGESIMRAGSVIEDMGMVLSGGVNIEIDDAWGNKTILSHVNPGQLFAETYACIPGEPLLVNVTASEKSTILFLNASKVMTTCSNACLYHNKLIHNLLIALRRNRLSALRTASLSDLGKKHTHIVVNFRCRPDRGSGAPESHPLMN